MMDLSNAKVVAGSRQTRRALNQGKAAKLLLAADADPRVLEPLARLAGEKGIRAQVIPTMKELGAACGIPVGCAVATLLK